MSSFLSIYFYIIDYYIVYYGCFQGFPCLEPVDVQILDPFLALGPGSKIQAAKGNDLSELFELRLVNLTELCMVY